MTLRFSVLGPVGCERDGDVVSLGGPQQRRVLAVLVADAGHVVPVDRLVDAIWADDPPDGARRTAMSYLSRLRSALGNGHVATVGAGYRLDAAADSIDVVRFEELVDRSRRLPPTEVVSVLGEALGLWRGPAFGEFHDEWWALPHATRLDELRLAATEDRIEAMLGLGDLSRAISELEGLVAAHPLRERLVGQLVRAHAAAGRQPEALRAFQQHRDRLAEETGLEPSAALVELERAVLEGAPPPTVPSGRALRGYQLGEVVGEGAYGTVYRSVQPGIGREVAVKVIRADRADDERFVRRFETEAQVVAHLEHPHIVPLYDYWREPGGAYLVFRLLRGGSVQDDLARSGPWPLARVTTLVEQIGGALASAHDAGVVHRDVKPSNLLLDGSGNVYLGDFGIAMGACDPGVSASSSSRSPIYAPPEQLTHEEPSGLVDQYSLAVVVRELLTGEPTSIELADVDGLGADEPRSHPSGGGGNGAGIPASVEAVLRRASEARPGDRHPDMRSFVAAWREAIVAPPFGGAGGTGSRAARAPGTTTTVPIETGPGQQAPVSNPYVGLRSFEAGDARRFRGRDQLADELAATIARAPFTAVVGASGSGKSSLLHAGAIPRLQEAGHRVVTLAPGDDPTAQLRLALLSVARRQPRGERPADLVRSVATEGGGTLTVVVDQFEELWTLTPDAERRTFVRGLVDLATVLELAPVRIVVAIRADFYDRPLGEPELAPLVADGTFPVVPMTAAELHEAIVGPAQSVGVGMEAGLASELVGGAVDQPAGLPLLQFTLTELFERRRGDVIERATYDALGGMGGALASRAEAILGELDADDVERARHLFLRLVVPGDGTEDTRRRVRRSELPPGTDVIADHLERHRLLAGDRDPSTREPTVEVAHESLLRSWPRLRAWLNEDRDALRALRHLGTAAQAWEEAGRPEAELYRGSRLEVAEDLAEVRPDDLTDQEHEFVRAGVARVAEERARDRRGRRRLRRLLIGTAAALVVALLAGLVALVQRQEAVDHRRQAVDQRRAAQRQAADAKVAGLVSLSESLSSSKRDIAALLALEASRRSPDAASDGALMTALYSDPTFLGYLRGPGEHLGGQLSATPDGLTLFSNPQSDAQRTVRFDLRTGHAEEVGIPGQGYRSAYLVAAVDDRRLVVSPENSDPRQGLARRVRLVDVDDEQGLVDVDVGARTEDLSVSPDGRLVAVTLHGVANRPARVEVFDTERLRVVRTWTIPHSEGEAGEDWPGGSVWLDDDRVVTGGPDGEIDIWRPSTGALVRRLNVGPGKVWQVSDELRITKDRRTILTARDSQDGGAGLMAFDVATGRAKWATPKPAASRIEVDDRAGTVYGQEAGFGSSRLIGYDIDTGERTGRMFEVHQGNICDTELISGGTVLAVSSCDENAIGLWSLTGDDLTATAAAPIGWTTGGDLWGSTGWLGTWDGRDLAAPTIFEDQRTGRRIPNPIGGGHRLAFLPDGRLLGLPDEGRTVTIADLDRGTTSRFDVELPDRPIATAVDRTSRYVVVAGESSDVIALVDLRRERVAQRIPTGVAPVVGAAFSPDGATLYIAGQGGRAVLFEVATGRRIGGMLDGVSNITGSADGRLLATSSYDGSIRVYRTVGDGLRLMGEPLVGATVFAPSMAFTADGRLLVTLGLDKTLRVWHVASGSQLGPGIAVTGTDFSLSPDAKTIAVATAAGVQRFRLDRASLRKAACRAAGRDLVDEEWRRYIGGTPHRLCP